MVRFLGRTQTSAPGPMKSSFHRQTKGDRVDPPSTIWGERLSANDVPSSKNSNSRKERNSVNTSGMQRALEFDTIWSVGTKSKDVATTTSRAAAHLGKSRSLQEFVNDGLISSNRAALLLGMNPQLTLQTFMSPKQLHTEVEKLKSLIEGSIPRSTRNLTTDPSGRKLSIISDAESKKTSVTMKSEVTIRAEHVALDDQSEVNYIAEELKKSGIQSTTKKQRKGLSPPDAVGMKWDDAGVRRRVLDDSSSQQDDLTNPKMESSKSQLHSVNQNRSSVPVKSQKESNTIAHESGIVRPLLHRKSITQTRSGKQKTKAPLSRSTRSTSRSLPVSTSKHDETHESLQVSPAGSLERSARESSSVHQNKAEASSRRKGFWYQSKARSNPVDNRVSYLLRKSRTREHDDTSASSDGGSGPSIDATLSSASIPRCIKMENDKDATTSEDIGGRSAQHVQKSVPVEAKKWKNKFATKLENPMDKIAEGEESRGGIHSDNSSTKKSKNAKDAPGGLGSSQSITACPAEEDTTTQKVNRSQTSAQDPPKQRTPTSQLQQQLNEETTIMLMSFSESSKSEDLFSFETGTSSSSDTSSNHSGAWGENENGNHDYDFSDSESSYSDDSGASSSYAGRVYDMASPSNLTEIMHAVNNGARAAFAGNFDRVEATETSDSIDYTQTEDNSTIASSTLMEHARSSSTASIGRISRYSSSARGGSRTQGRELHPTILEERNLEFQTVTGKLLSSSASKTKRGRTNRKKREATSDNNVIHTSEMPTHSQRRHRSAKKTSSYSSSAGGSGNRHLQTHPFCSARKRPIKKLLGRS